MGFSEKSDIKYYGAFGLNVAPLAVILNSRQGKIPCGKDKWVQNTLRAAQYAAEHNWTIITSIGMNTWEMALWACSRAGGRQVIACPANFEGNYQNQMDNIIKDFNLSPEKVGWLFHESTIKSRSPKSNWPQRDKLVIDTAQILIPVSVRPGGNLDKLITIHRNKRVIKDFKTDYLKQSSERIVPPESDTISRQLIDINWDYICHWTHTLNGPWPGQSHADYYRNITESDIYPNGGLGSLINILQTRRIYASSKNIRDNQRVVAFSNLHPKDVLSLMTWRKRYVRYNFEPYGIAISRRAATALGIRPVIYGPSTLCKRLSDSDKPFFQSEGENGGDWRPENEWRCLGDLDLSVIPDSEIIVFVRDRAQITKIRELGEWRIEAFCR
ncbi:MAG: hypothetical protein GX409_09030 [candidate division Zixibacteria bacterium]|nr:hypothetical protein [candidate division Zixibacteria bacterium]